MKKIKICAIALFSVFISTNMNAEFSASGTCTDIQMGDTWIITCAKSNQTCFVVTDDGYLYFPSLGVSYPGFGDPVENDPGTGVWSIPHE